MGPEAKSKKSNSTKKTKTKKTTKNTTKPKATTKKTTNTKSKTKTATKQTKPNTKPVKKEPVEHKIETKEKNGFKSKNIVIIASVVVLICIVAAVVMFSSNPISAEAKAQLSFDSETSTALVKHEEGSWETAINGMDLYPTDSIKTGDDSTVSIILFKGSIIRLDSNTEITIEEIIEEDQTSVSIEQSTGRTWNTIQGMSGIDNYEVKTPTTVASVRGTSFDVNVSEEGITIISVVEGNVSVTQTKDGVVINLSKNHSIKVGFDEIGETQEFEYDQWILDNIGKDKDLIDELKAYIYEKIEPHLDELKSEIPEITDEEIDILVEGFVKGNFNIPSKTPDEFKKLFLE